MSDVKDDVRKGVSQAIENKESGALIWLEILISAIGIGFYFKSWYAFGGGLVGLIVLSFIPYVSKLLCVIFGVAWGFLGMGVGSMFGKEAGYVLGVLGLIIGIAVNFEDLRRRNQKLDDIS